MRPKRSEKVLIHMIYNDVQNGGHLKMGCDYLVDKAVALVKQKNGTAVDSATHYLNKLKESCSLTSIKIAKRSGVSKDFKKTAKELGVAVSYGK